jgi:Putative auto-transporter adhesin, head GIN domain
MKNSIKNLAAALTLTGVLFTGSAFATKTTDNPQVTVLAEVKKVNKINVAGNVELILVQSADESVKVYDNYFSKNALVQQKDGELRISSFEKETLTVVFYAAQINEITASNDASVKTFGKFNGLDLSVNLKDNATAQLNTNTISLNTNVNGNANLTLSGTTETLNAVLGSVAKVNMDNFAAQSTSIKSKNVMVAKALAQPTLLTSADFVAL